VPEMKDFDAAPVLVHLIVDVQRGMEKPPDLKVPFYRATDVRKGFKKIEVIEKIVGKPLSRFGVLILRPTENLLQIG
jgi:hypothetical protein